MEAIGCEAFLLSGNSTAPFASQPGSHTVSRLRGQGMPLKRVTEETRQRAIACELLGLICGWLADDFDTIDLQDARALLDEISS